MRLMLAFVAAVVAVASPVAASPESEIFAANSRWTDAVAKKDMAAVEAIVAPGFRLTSGDAKDAIQRAAWLANLSKLQIAAYKIEITDLEVHGDTAISTVSGSWDVALGNKKWSDKFQLLDIWVRGPSGWQVVRRHITGE